MTDTINNKIPFVPENTIDPAAGLNLSLNTMDALLQVIVQSVGLNTPPTGVEGQRFIVGTAPTGAWAGQTSKLARFMDGAWQFFDARYVLNAADGAIWVRPGSTWAALAGGGGGGSGTVTSVALTAPTGFDVSGSPIIGAGTLGLSFSAGYSLPTDTSQEGWSAAFSWGNHALAGYEKALTAGANITIDRTDPDKPVISSTAAGGGGGDVLGPAGAAANGVALFDGTTGKLLKDGGILGSAAFTDSTSYATSAQGMLADSSLQVSDIGTTLQGWSANLDSWSAILPTAKQDTLVSATNIKTINGASVLGSGNLTVSGVATWGSITGTLSDQADLQAALASKINSSDKRVCTALVNFDGTGATAIRDSFNVSSVTDNAVGNYTVTFSTPMTNTNYIALVTLGNASGSNAGVRIISTAYQTSGFQFTTGVGGTNADYEIINVIVFGGK